MTEAWKSVPKKFCELCKCWFYDNKVSIQHHEQGQRHKESVARKLREIGKKSRDQEHEASSTRSALAQMERAAVAAYKRDMKEDPNNVSAYNIHMNLAALPIAAAPSIANKRPRLEEDSSTTATTRKGDKPIWYENQSIGPDDVTIISYYWNIRSGETVWELPRGVPYVSWTEQQQRPGSSSQELQPSSYNHHQQEIVDPPKMVEAGKCKQQQRKMVQQGERKVKVENNSSSSSSGEDEDEDEGKSKISNFIANLKPYRSAEKPVSKDGDESKAKKLKKSKQEETVEEKSPPRKPYGDWQVVEAVTETRKDEFAYLPHNRWVKDKTGNEEEEDEDLDSLVHKDDNEDLMKMRFGERTAPSRAPITGGSGSGGSSKGQSAGGGASVTFKKRTTSRRAAGGSRASAVE